MFVSGQEKGKVSLNLAKVWTEEGGGAFPSPDMK